MPTAIEAREPIYCAEQIKVPDGYSDIIKDYAKFVIRTQPSNINAASISYFQNMVSKKVANPSTRLSEFQLESLYVRLNRPEPKITLDELKGACAHSQIAPQRVDEFISLGNWGSDIIWLQFWSLAVASATNDFASTVELTLELMSAENNKVPVSHAAEIFRYLAERNPATAKLADAYGKILGNESFVGKAQAIAGLRETLRI